MKNLLLIMLGFLILVALFADGGLDVSPTTSPRFEFSPNVSYAPDRSVTTVEQQTNIDTNIEHQTVIVQPGGATQSSGGVTLVDPAYRLCQPLPGETITEGPDGHGACFVVDAGGNHFFLNAAGSRWPMGAPGGMATLVAETVSAQPALQPATEPTLEQMQAAYLRNGGSLPLTWSWFSEDRKHRFLANREETWQ